MAHKNEKLVREALKAFISGDVPALSGFLAEDLMVHVPGSNRLSGDYKSREEFLSGFVGTIMELTGGQFQLDPHDVVAGDDHAVGIYNIRAVRDGKTIEWRHVNVYHIRDGSIAEVFQHPFEFEAWNAFWS